MKKLLHAIFGHAFEVIGYSVMGAPIERCKVCNQYAVVYGYGSYEHLITEEEVNKIWGEAA